MDDDVHVILYGSIENGYRVIGPFLDIYEAQEYALRCWGREDQRWTVMPVSPPIPQEEPYDIEEVLPHSMMILCPVCGNKRCPKATDPDLQCTGSNEPGQPGSAYGPPLWEEDSESQD